MAPPGASKRIAQRLNELYERHLIVEEGSVTRYYASGREYYGPELAGDERDRFAIALASPEGDVYTVGHDDVTFALQSMSKVFVYALAFQDHGRDHVLEHVGVEPSGDAFNSIVFDERNHKPFNPMVNAGALVTTDLVRGKDQEEKLQRILELMRTFAGNPSIDVDWDVFELELATADRNRATAYLMRSNGMLSGDVEAILALYLQQCSVTVTSHDLAVMG